MVLAPIALEPLESKYMPPGDEVKGISIDIGGLLGYTKWTDGFPHEAGTLQIAPEDSVPGEEYQMVKNFLRNLPLTDYHWAAYEDCVPRNKYHMYRHFGVLGHLAYECWKLGIPLLGITTGEWKKALGCKGNASKPEAQARALELYPHLEFPTLDASDALGIGVAALSRIRLSVGLE